MEFSWPLCMEFILPLRVLKYDWRELHLDKAYRNFISPTPNLRILEQYYGLQVEICRDLDTPAIYLIQIAFLHTDNYVLR